MPNRPDFDAPYGSFGAGVGTLAKSDGLSRRFEGMWNQPLAENLALRVVASRSESPGYIEDIRADKDDINASDATQLRGMLSWRATENLEFRLNALRRETRQDDSVFANNEERPEHSKRFYADVQESTTDLFLLTSDWNLGFANLVAVLSQFEKDYPQFLDQSQYLGTSLVGIGAYGEFFDESSQPSAELRLVSTRATESAWWLLRDWNYVAGYYFVDSDQSLLLDIGTVLTGRVANLGGYAISKENALFFDLTRPLSERWEFGLGGRFFRQSTRTELANTIVAVDGLIETLPLLGLANPLVEALPVLAAIPLTGDKGETGESGFNPKFTLQWRYSDSLSLFGSAVKGYRYAGVNSNLLNDPNIPLFSKSDSIWNYELGLRTGWLDGALQVDATVFQLDWDDVQIQQADITGLFPYTTNVGGARNRGVELSIDAFLPAGFAMKLNGSYVDARSTSFFDDFSGPAPAGTELPGTPPFSGSALLLWAHPFGSSEFTGTISYTYQNRNYNNLPHTYEHPALGLLGASASLRLPKWPGRPLLNLVGTNLTNEFEPGVIFETKNSGGILTTFNPPRSITLGLSFEFGGH
ncbi:MAG: TonB-dependent receptor [Panacagrimonas sp.]